MRSQLTALPSTSSFIPAANAELALTLLGPSTAMSQLWDQIRRLAPHIRTALLTGAPDAGQEAVARLLLDLSPAPRRPFVLLSPKDVEARLGNASAAANIPQEALVFLPDVDRLSATAQHNLLRLLRLRRSGGFSVVGATTEDLRAVASMGQFSAELAEYLGAVRIQLPSLSQRSEDVPMLLTHMLTHRAHVSQRPVPAIAESLLQEAMQYTWPGNLQELSGAVDQLLRMAPQGRELGAADLQRALLGQRPSRSATPDVRMIKLNTVMQEHTYAVLLACRGNKLKAAEVLGISRSTLYRMLETTTEDMPLPLAC